MIESKGTVSESPLKGRREGARTPPLRTINGLLNIVRVSAPLFGLLWGAGLSGCSKSSEQHDAFSASGNASDQSRPQWIKRLEALQPGKAKRRDVEALLPNGFRKGPAFGSSGLYREFYVISNDWQVAVIYQAPDRRYIASPGQVLLEGPYITRLNPDSRDTYSDPRGGFSIKKLGPTGDSNQQPTIEPQKSH